MQSNTPHYDAHQHALQEKAKLEEWDASFYAAHSEMQYQIGLETIRRLNPVDGEAILDIGCGDGRLTAELAQYVPNGRLTAVDISNNMLRLTKASLCRAGASHYNLINVRAEQIEFKDAFDGIFSNIALQWVRRRRELYVRLFQALKRGGRLAIATCYDSPELDDEEEPLVENDAQWYNVKLHEFEQKAVTELYARPEFRPYLINMSFQPQQHFYYIKTTRRRLESVGFTNISLDTLSFKTKYDSLEGYLSWGMDGYFDIFPSDLQQPFMEQFEEIMRGYLNDAPDKPDHFEYVDEWSVLFIQAEKPKRF
jgi:ubiquinone/menaquinone biosynthesis C-methylase UbiE